MEHPEKEAKEQSCDSAMDGFDDNSDITCDYEDGEWFAGDAVCPSTAQFNTVYQASYNACTRALHQNEPEARFWDLITSKLFWRCSRASLDSITIPERRRFAGWSQISPYAGFLLGTETTDDLTCDQRWKNVVYLQILGRTAPMIYEIRGEKLELRVPRLLLGCLENRLDISQVSCSLGHISFLLIG